MNNFDLLRQALLAPAAGITAQQHSCGLQSSDQCRHQGVAIALYAGVVQLGDQVIPEAVHHHARKTVAVTVDQSITGFVENPLAQVQGDLQSLDKQGLVQRALLTWGIQPGADK